MTGRLNHHNTVNPNEYQSAIRDWVVFAHRAGTLRRESSITMYEHMWAGFTAWAVGSGYELAALTPANLVTFLTSRAVTDELSPRYAWRMLRLIDRVLEHAAHSRGHAPNRAATRLLAQRPELRFANAEAHDDVPQVLDSSEAKVLVTYLSAVRPGRRSNSLRWQDVRNRAAVALMLGAGITPGEVRALEIHEVIVAGGRRLGVPWKLHVAGNGNSPARETPVAAWAGRLLAYWLTLRAEQAMPGSMVFPATRATGKIWGKVSQYKAAKEVLAAAGIDASEGGSFRLRHTFALRQLRRGVSPDEVGRWLGVSDPPVMARYQRLLASPVDVS